MSAPEHILSEVDKLVDEWLNISFKATAPLYRHKTALNEVSKRSAIPPATEFLQKAYRQIDQNWNAAVQAGNYSRSRQNWRFTQHTTKNNSPEVGLERAIISAADEQHWANQVPTSSGLVGPHRGKRSCVDLVQRGDDGNFTLIELKVESDTPLFAAVEILTYGLLLAWSRNNAERLSYDHSGQPVLGATSVQLDVLAPADYYDGLKLDSLTTAINHGLRESADTLCMPYSFAFTRFEESFDIGASPDQLFKYAAERESAL